MLPLVARGGLALDVAAGRGRNTLALARAGMRVVAADFSKLRCAFSQSSRAGAASIWPVVADFDKFAFRDRTLDAIVNVNFLDRARFPDFARALKPGGILIAETFLIDQAEIGHPKDPRFLLKHYELRDLVADLELLRYREGFGRVSGRLASVARGCSGEAN